MKNHRRTTVVLDRKDREFLEGLIRSGKETGIKPFIEKMLDIYRNMAIHDWRYPGECYVGASRVAFINQESISVLTEMIPPGKRGEAGRKLGEVHKTALLTGFGVDSGKEESWDEVFRRLSVLGYGEINRRDNILVLKNPIFGDVAMLIGFLETLLGRPMTAKTTVSPVVVEVGRASDSG